MARRYQLGEQPAKTLITRSGRNIRATARAAGLNPTHVYAAVCGFVVPDDATRTGLAAFLGVAVEECWTTQVLSEPFDYKRRGDHR